MAIPDATDENAVLWKRWRILRKQWGAESVRLKLTLNGGDPDGYFDPETNTINLNMERIKESAPGNPVNHALKVMRHEMAHWQSGKVDSRETMMTHGGRFPWINRSIGGATGADSYNPYPELPAELLPPPGRTGRRGLTLGS